MGEAELIAFIEMDGMSGFEGNTKKAESLFQSLGDVAQNVMQGIVSGIQMAWDAFLKFTTDAIAEATKVQKNTLTFGGLFGDMAKGQAETAYIRQRAKEILGTSDDALQAGVRFAAAGLNYGHFVRQWNTLAQIAGGGAVNQNMFSDMYVRWASGSNYGRGFAALRRTGIGYEDFRQEGIKISAGNKIDPSTTPEQMFKALDNVFEKHGFGRVAKALEESMAVAYVNLQDSWNILLENFGRAWFPLVTRLINSVTPFINFLTDTGRIEKLGKSFAALFDTLFSKFGGENAVSTFLLYFITAMEMLPSLIMKAGQIGVQVATAVGNAMITGLNNVQKAALEIINPIREMLGYFLAGRVLGGSGTTSDMGDAIALRVPIPYRPISPLEDLLKGGADIFTKGFAGFGPEFKDRFGKAKADYDEYMKNPPKKLENPQGEGIWGPGHQDRDSDNLTAIKENTAKVVAHMVDFKRYTLGGGDYAQRFVSVSEIYGSRGGRNRGPIKVDVRSGNAKMDEALGDMFSELMQSYHRGQ